MLFLPSQKKNKTMMIKELNQKSEKKILNFEMLIFKIEIDQKN